MTLVPNGTRVSNIETDNTYPFASIEAIGVVGDLPHEGIQAPLGVAGAVSAPSRIESSRRVGVFSGD